MNVSILKHTPWQLFDHKHYLLNKLGKCFSGIVTIPDVMIKVIDLHTGINSKLVWCNSSLHLNVFKKKKVSIFHLNCLTKMIQHYKLPQNRTLLL